MGFIAETLGKERELPEGGMRRTKVLYGAGNVGDEIDVADIITVVDEYSLRQKKKVDQEDKLVLANWMRGMLEANVDKEPDEQEIAVKIGRQGCLIITRWMLKWVKLQARYFSGGWYPAQNNTNWYTVVRRFYNPFNLKPEHFRTNKGAFGQIAFQRYLTLGVYCRRFEAGDLPDRALEPPYAFKNWMGVQTAFKTSSLGHMDCRASNLMVRIYDDEWEPISRFEVCPVKYVTDYVKTQF